MLKRISLPDAFRDCEQITFVMPTRFCPLSKKKPPSPPVLNDIVFHKFLELYPTLSQKKDCHHEFSFFNGFTQPPLTAKILEV